MNRFHTPPIAVFLSVLFLGIATWSTRAENAVPLPMPWLQLLLESDYELNLSHRSAVPGTFITIEDPSIANGQPLDVLFKDSSGFEILIPASLTESGRALVLLPPLFNPYTGSLDTGEWTVSLPNGKKDSIQIQAVSALDGMEAGFVVKKYLQFIIDNYGIAMEGLDQRDESYGYEPADIKALIQKQIDRIQGYLDNLNTAGVLELDSLDQGQFVLAQSDLKFADTLLYAMLKGIAAQFATEPSTQVFSYSSSGASADSFDLDEALRQIKENAANLESLVYGGAEFERVKGQIRVATSALVGNLRALVDKVGGPGAGLADLGLEGFEGVTRILIDGVLSDVVKAIGKDKYGAPGRVFGQETVNAIKGVISDSISSRLPVDTALIIALINGDTRHVEKIYRQLCNHALTPADLIPFCIEMDKLKNKIVFPAVNIHHLLPPVVKTGEPVTLWFSIHGYLANARYSKHNKVYLTWDKETGVEEVLDWEMGGGFVSRENIYLLPGHQDKEYRIVVKVEGVEEPFHSQPHEQEVTVLVKSDIPSLEVSFSKEPSRILDVNEPGYWSVEVAGGQPPYDTKISWGDNRIAEKKNSYRTTYSGHHAYAKAGAYPILFRVTDKNGVTATATTSQYVGQHPIVSVVATDASASEDGDPGKFTLTRTGDLSHEFSVDYSLGGDALPVEDYATSGLAVTFPGGSSTLDVIIEPIEDSIKEGDETVTLSINENFDYHVGIPDSAELILSEPVLHVCEDSSIPYTHYEYRCATFWGCDGSIRYIKDNVICMNNYYEILTAGSLDGYTCEEEGFEKCTLSSSETIFNRGTNADGIPWVSWNFGNTWMYLIPIE